MKREINRRIERQSRNTDRSAPTIVWSPSEKVLAIYGKYVTLSPVRQRYWKKRRDGIKQRYWKTTKRVAPKGPVKSGRIELHGRGKTLYKAVALAHRVMPEGFVEVSAEEFLRNPYEYGVEGHWIHREVES